jgi:predicted transcriptional regulator
VKDVAIALLKNMPEEKRKEIERELLDLIAKEPHKQKTYYIFKLSKNQNMDDILRLLLVKFKRRGYLEEIKDGSRRRYRITHRGFKYLASIRG